MRSDRPPAAGAPRSLEDMTTTAQELTSPPAVAGVVTGDAPGAGGDLLGNLAAAARQIVPLVLWGILPLAVIAGALAGSYEVHYAGDFHYSYWPAGQHVLEGTSPYVDPDAPEVARAIAFVYPALGALALAPFALVPRELADALFTALNIAAVPLTLLVLRIRDWRLYGAALLCLPVLSGWLVGNVTLLLMLGIALLWRHRDRPAAAGVLAAVIVSFKLFLWPLGLWLLATRRYVAVGWAVASGVAINAAAWAVLGFDEIGRYRDLLRALAGEREDLGFSVVSVALREGVGHTPAYVLMFALAALAGAACIALGRRGREPGALALALAVCLLASPVVQLHYFALLLVPFVLARPRMGWAWVLPLAFWVCSPEGPAWEAAVGLALGAAIVAVCMRADLSVRAPATAGSP